MNIQTQFDVGTYLWNIVDEPGIRDIICDTCNGSNKLQVEIFGHIRTIDCPDSGRHKYITNLIVYGDKINHLAVESTLDEETKEIVTDISYQTDNWFIEEEELKRLLSNGSFFKSKKEAVAKYLELYGVEPKVSITPNLNRPQALW